MVFPTRMEFLRNKIHMTQEELKKLHELHAPEYVERDGILYYCPYNNMFDIWHNANDGNPNYPEWNYVGPHSLEYIAYTGNYKPDKEAIVSCDDLFKYLIENHYWCKVVFNPNDGNVYEYKPSIHSDIYKYRTVKMW